MRLADRGRDVPCLAEVGRNWQYACFRMTHQRGQQPLQDMLKQGG
ncbi:hypothetical protein APS_0406 [Acetobacter pasteurianus subsp. pasteurianus LMG 1262 = NBRC 106471]|nr:hypothetical protein APS_0406 [Acetobacter pasteurianus subsp. pasteurianus LMG 1262 = NBRC 106471]